MLARKLNEVLGKRQLFSRVTDVDVDKGSATARPAGPASRDDLTDIVAISTGAIREAVAAADVETTLFSSFASAAAFAFSAGGRGASRTGAGHTTDKPDTTLLRRLALRHMQLA